MMHRTSRHVAAFFVAIAPLTIGCQQVKDDITFIVPADEAFSSTLSGANVVPAVTTPAAGVALFSIVSDTFLVFRLDVATIDSTTTAHIHQGVAGDTGGVIVTLFVGPTLAQTGCSAAQSLSSPRCRVAFTGQLAAGQFKASVLDTLNRSPTDTTAVGYAALLTLLRAGNAYIDVHTTRTPAGEIRGQIGP